MVFHLNKIEMLNIEVSGFLDELNHPFRAEIELLRNYLMTSNNQLTENIKWNGPNYCIENEDRITMRVQPLAKKVQLIFHRGAKKQIQPATKLIANPSKLLVWKENDRAIITFKSLDEITNAKSEFVAIVNEWISATK
jgi:hypothetical protein